MAGVAGAARQVLAEAVELGRLRVELATVEIEEERLRLARLLVGATLTLCLALVAVLLVAGWLVLWAAPEHRLAVLGGLALAFVAGAAAAGWHWRRLAAAKPALLHETLQQLRDAAATARRRPRPGGRAAMSAARRAAALAQRRAQLAQRAAAQRQRVAGSLARLRGELAPERLLQRAMDRGLAALGLGTGAARGAAGAGAGAVRWAGLLLLAWRWWRRARGRRRA